VKRAQGTVDVWLEHFRPSSFIAVLCSAQYLDNMSLWDRYIMTVKYLVDQVSDSESLLILWNGALIIDIVVACAATPAV
jgi:hypothetical protein